MTNPTEEQDTPQAVALAADIVVAYVANNTVASGDLPKLIADVHTALLRLSGPVAEPEPKPEPAVPVKKSVTPDFIICLEDGKKFKSLKRHLRTRYDLTPDAYRQKWGLPADYPMVAPNYAAARSELAKTIGLGQQRKKDEPPPPVEAKPRRGGRTKAAPAEKTAAAAAKAAPAPARRSRKPKAEA